MVSLEKDKPVSLMKKVFHWIYGKAIGGLVGRVKFDCWWMLLVEDFGYWNILFFPLLYLLLFIPYSLFPSENPSHPSWYPIRPKACFSFKQAGCFIPFCHGHSFPRYPASLVVAACQRTWAGKAAVEKGDTWLAQREIAPPTHKGSGCIISPSETGAGKWWGILPAQ